MLKKIFSLFAALTLSVGLWAQGSVFTYTATEKLESQFNSLGTVASHEFNNGAGTVTYNGTVTTIGESAFIWCESLNSISLPAGVTTIEKYTFQGCSSLQSITLPASVTTIGNYAFVDCSNLKSITIPANVTTIGEYAFDECSNLRSITIPANVTTIGKYTFALCSALEKVVFLGNACQDAIGDYAFNEVGKDRPALLQLPANWIGGKPDKYGKWYGGMFRLQASPTALPTLFGDDVKGNKFLHNGQLIIRKNGKLYNAVGVVR